MKKLTALVLALGIFVVASSASAGTYRGSVSSGLWAPPEAVEKEQPLAARLIVDVLIARPIGFASTILGTGVFVAWLPYTLPTLSVGESAKGLIVDPFKFTFMRPLGEMTDPFRQLD